VTDCGAVGFAALKGAHMGTTFVVLADVDAHGVIEHLVVYRQEAGALTSICGSWEPGPFFSPYEACQWLTRTLTANGMASAR
jgi:hypothetical protein